MEKESLDKFKIIFKKVYGIDLTEAQVLDLATNLLNLYRAVYKENLNINIKKYEKEIQSTKNQD